MSLCDQKLQVVFGCHSIATLPRRRQALDLLQKVFAYGIRNFDTAPLYSQGYSECILGRAFCFQEDVKISSKTGACIIHSSKLPLVLAMPLNFVRRKLFGGSATNASLNLEHAGQSTEDLPSPLLSIQSSLFRLQRPRIDALLLHEILPFRLGPLFLADLHECVNSGQVARLGYGGEFHEGLLSMDLPHWLRLLQFPFPADIASIHNLSQWLESHPEHEVRLFGLFRLDNSALIHEAKLMLRRHSNLKILFSCRSIQRFEENCFALGV